MCQPDKHGSRNLLSFGEFNCAEIAVGNPGIPNFYGQQHRFKQRSFLCMAIFTRKYVNWQTQHGIINDQGIASYFDAFGI